MFLKNNYFKYYYETTATTLNRNPLTRIWRSLHRRSLERSSRGLFLLYRSKTYKPKRVHLFRSEALPNSNPRALRVNTPLGVFTLNAKLFFSKKRINKLILNKLMTEDQRFIFLNRKLSTFLLMRSN